MPQVFEVEPVACDDCLDVKLNGQLLQPESSHGSKRYFVNRHATTVNISDQSGSYHSVTVNFDGSVSSPDHVLREGSPREYVTQIFGYSITTVDGRQVPPITRFTTEYQSAGRSRKLQEIMRTVAPETVDFTEFHESFMEAQPLIGTVQDDTHTSESASSSSGFDFEEEIEALSLLGEEMDDLQARIRAKEQSIINHIREHDSKMPLKQLLRHCDGLLCAARVIAERICDKVGMRDGPHFGYSLVQQNSHLQHMQVIHDDANKPQQNARNCTKSKWSHRPNPDKGAQAASIQLMLTKNGSTKAYPQFQPIDLVHPTNPWVRALEIIAGILGIAALCAFIRRRCMSMRRRVERAADKEERRNRRAYRRAARRASMRRRWDAFVTAVSCFGQEAEPRIEDYEEKRALILQDAFLEQDLDQAERGEVMEAEIRELRHAHEIVASLVRVDEHRYDLVTPLHDPPPPMVPLPYTPEARSRASTGTLPSYTSESLPDYTSQRRQSGGSNGIVLDGFTQYTPTSTDEEGRYTPDGTGSESSRLTRYTPLSSIIAISPRCSEETLRTRQSKDS